MTELSSLNYQVTPADEQLRIDVLLQRLIPSKSRTEIQEMVSGGLVFINGQKPKSSHRVKTGELISAALEQRHRPETKHLTLSPMNLDIRYEDEELLVVNKPAGMVVHPGAGTRGPTLVEGVLAHTSILSEDAAHPLRPGVVHRLDADTTGLLVMAKTRESHVHLARQFQEKTNKRLYIALLHGVLKEERQALETYYQRHPTQRELFQALSKSEATRAGIENLEALRIAKTEFSRLRVFGESFTLAQAALQTGRTHQIRVHASYIGHAVVGDPRYGKPMRQAVRKELPGALVESISQIRRQLLHAACLGFIHPKSHEWLEFYCAPPEDFAAILAQLSEHFRLF
jgi:23S rRNA pseudouridine1911/1915/1917 synthase